MRKKIAAGNWKMNLNATEAHALVSEVINLYKAEYSGNAEVVFAPSYPFLGQVASLVAGEEKIHASAQNLHQEDKGAYTGEVSASMLTSIGVSHVIIGHSERRQYQKEDNALLAVKVKKALAAGLVPIYCFGETLEEREAGKVEDVVGSQISEALFDLSAGEFGEIILAYEPVWAIGTGVTASPNQAQEVHAFIRKLLADKYGASVSDDTTILYGGSVKPANATDLFSQGDIDGGLVGGASLKPRDFVEIIKALP